MEVITDSFSNITLSQLHSELAKKQAQLQKIDHEESIKNTQATKDFYDPSNPKNYDEQDFQRVLSKFKEKDAQIKAHEQSHAANAPTVGGISYNYQQGPDGKMYAVGGSVRLDVSMPQDPKSAELKLEQLKKSALSVDDPSGADMTIASQANLNKMLLQQKEEDETNANNQNS